LGPDLLLYAFITNIAMQFDILCREIKELKDVSPNEIEKRFGRLVEKHVTLIILSDNLEMIYSPAILSNTIGSSIMCA
jgi:hypothetical protein